MAQQQQATPDDILDQLDLPVSQAELVPSDALNNQQMLAYYQSEKQVPVMLSTPDNYPGVYHEWVQINGVGFIIKADEIVMVPESVKAVLDNKKAQNALVSNQVKAAREKLMYANINQVPEYVR